ncbi:hypothetical protein Ciccas_011562 [Cichlidogyrus casuarinus]|uniref:Rho-GAP domain-containing protein n=1 Tax=Cichlidogyrus casuarinus TaxID=1844966 RepID=A0ABD2PQX8_9PLAT
MEYVFTASGLQQKEASAFLRDCDGITMACGLKQFIRNLDEPLIPYDLYERFIALGRELKISTVSQIYWFGHKRIELREQLSFRQLARVLSWTLRSIPRSLS